MEYHRRPSIGRKANRKCTFSLLVQPGQCNHTIVPQIPRSCHSLSSQGTPLFLDFMLRRNPSPSFHQLFVKYIHHIISRQGKHTTEAMTPTTEYSNLDASWASLVRRSIDAWEHGPQKPFPLHKDILQTLASLDDFLREAPQLAMFWFFQRREAFLSQERTPKWNRNRLDDYILLPASNGYVTRSECFFVSHFWQTSHNPDPDGDNLRLLQNELQTQAWSYIWIDWACIPQHPRSKAEEGYFLRSLDTMSGIIRNCAFIWYYPPFEARLWILYEVAEYILTSEDEFFPFPDVKTFSNHVYEMVETGVRPTLEKYGYRCAYERDRKHLTSWLEVLVLLRRLHVDLYSVRQLLDSLTWFPNTKVIFQRTNSGGWMQMLKYEGILSIDGREHTFTPFPQLHTTLL